MTNDIDFAAKITDCDQIIEIMYDIGFKIPTSVSEDEQTATWAKTHNKAAQWADKKKLGALNFYLLSPDHDILGQVDFVFETGIPFSRLLKEAKVISENPILRVASMKHILAMKEKRIQAGQGSGADTEDIAFIKSEMSR